MHSMMRRISCSSLMIFVLAFHHLLCGSSVYGTRLGKFGTKLNKTHPHTQLVKESQNNNNDMKKEEDYDMKKSINNSKVAKTGADEIVEQIDNVVSCNDCQKSKGKSSRKLFGPSSTLLLIKSTWIPKPIQKKVEEINGASNKEKKRSLIRGEKVGRMKAAASSVRKSDKNNKKYKDELEEEAMNNMTVMDYSSATKKPPIHN